MLELIGGSLIIVGIYFAYLTQTVFAEFALSLELNKQGGQAPLPELLLAVVGLHPAALLVVAHRTVM